MKKDFVHLHTHTAYSLLDGAIKIPDLMQLVKRIGMESVAITDHGNMFGVLDFYINAIAHDIKPIVGCEVYVSPGDRKYQGKIKNLPVAYHLVLLAKNFEGYKNLVNLVSAGYLEGFYYKPRIDYSLLKEKKEGLIALSGCLQGKVSNFLVRNRYDEALLAAKELSRIMGPDNFFIEMQDTGVSDQKRINPALIDIAQQVGVGLVATNDCHFLLKEHYTAQDALLCIQTGKELNDRKRIRLQSKLYFKTAEEMIELFGDIPEVIENTVGISERCNLEIPFGKKYFPKCSLKEGETSGDVLRFLALKGLKKRFIEIEKRCYAFDINEYEKRLKYELDVLVDKGFAGYFLVVSDFINWAKNSKIPVGPGRGSAAGSLVAYALNITDLDPIRYKLIFERFLNVERGSMPDIDIDFCMERRNEVLGYVSEKYGKLNVAQISTFGSMQAKAVIRDVGRVLRVPYNEVDKVVNYIPSELGITLKETLDKEPRLRAFVKEKVEIKSLIKIARMLEGLPRHASTHAAGVVISDIPLTEIVPIYKGSKGEIVTQFDMKSVEKIGLIKFDFLGLRTLTVIDLAVEMIKRNYNERFDINDIDLEDQDTYKLLVKGDTVGVFQLESSGMKELLGKIIPECFEDVIALVALYRPGPLESGMVDDFIDCKHGRKKVDYFFPQLKNILKDTYGVIVYQEQVQEIARILAGYSLGEGDILRRAMGKKVPEIMEQQRDRFIQGAKKKRIDLKQASELFDLLVKFAGYGFNKSHSAAYGLIAFQTAYLKTHYLLEFMSALLTSEIGNSDKVMLYIAECRERQIPILPPDVNRSDQYFSVDKKSIRFGLAAVKNVGKGAVESILSARRKDGPYKNIFDFCERVDLSKINRRVLESLVKAGAFDFAGFHRSQSMAVVDDAIRRGQQLNYDREIGQGSIFDLIPKNKIFSETSAFPSALSEWDKHKKLKYERESLGFYITGHPLLFYEKKTENLSYIDTLDVKNISNNKVVSLIGMLTDLKEKITKKGDRMAFVRLEDLKGFVELIVFSNYYDKYIDILKSGEPVFVKGTVSKNERGVKVKIREIKFLRGIVEGISLISNFILNIKNFSSEKLEAFRLILKKYKGSTHVNLKIKTIEGEKVFLRLPEKYKIKISDEFLAKINSLSDFIEVDFEI